MIRTDRPELQSRKQRTEAGNQAIDQIRHVLKRFDQRLRLKNLRLAERYIEAELHLLVHFRIREIGEEFVAYLQRAQAVSGPQEEIHHRKVSEPSGGFGIGGQTLLKTAMKQGTNIDAAKGRPNGGQSPVFVDVVKLVESPESIVPTFIRLDCI